MKYDIGRKRIYSNQFKNVKDVVRWEVLNIKQDQEFILTFISTNSKYRQGVRLAIDVGEGYIEINDVKSTEVWLWENEIPQEIHVRCVSTEGLLSVYNAFYIEQDKKSRGRPWGKQSGDDSCGMLIESHRNKIVFKCNDVGFESNFDKLIFQIELL